MNMEEIYQIIAMYAPTVLTALGVVATWVKIFKGLKDNASNIMNDTRMIALKEELNNTKEQLTNVQSQMAEMIRRQGELINELSKIEKYEDKDIPWTVNGR